MFKRFLISMLAAGSAVSAHAQEVSDELWQQISFTATEVLIYTDQLAKLDATSCNPSAVSAYDIEVTRTALLNRLPTVQRSQLEAVFASPLVAQMLEENRLGIEAMLGKPAITGVLTDKQRNDCLELSLAFADNRAQAESDLLELLQQAGWPSVAPNN